MEYRAIKTKEIGIIYGRDAIYLDEFSSSLTGINSDKHFIPYIFSFSGVIYYQCCELDLYINEKKIRFIF